MRWKEGGRERERERAREGHFYAGSIQGSVKARLSGCIKVWVTTVVAADDSMKHFKLYYGSIQALFRLYSDSIPALLRCGGTPLLQ